MVVHPLIHIGALLMLVILYLVSESREVQCEKALVLIIRATGRPLLIELYREPVQHAARSQVSLFKAE